MASTYGGEVNTPTLSASRIGHLIQSLSLYGDVLADAGRAAHRAQPHACVQRPDFSLANDFDGFSGTVPKTSATVRRSAQKLWVQHRGLGQIAQYARGPDHVQGAIRLLADRLRLPIFLRLPCWGGLAVRTEPDAEHDPGGSACDRSQGLPSLLRTSPTTPFDWLREQQAFAPDKPFLMYWAPGAAHAPHQVPTERADKVQGQVRRRMGQVSRARFCPPEAVRLDRRTRR